MNTIALRGGRALAGDRETGVGHLGAVRGVVQLRARQRSRRQVRAQERERVDADREPGLAVVGEHPLPAGEIAQLRGRRGGIERERELLRLAARALAPRAAGRRGRAPRAGRAACRRSSRTRRPRRVPRARPARAGRVARGRRRPGRPVRVALGHERRRVVLSDRCDVREPDPHRVRPGALQQNVARLEGAASTAR